MAWVRKNGILYAENADGSLSRAKFKSFKSHVVLNETVDGRWIKKIEAIREGVALTGAVKVINSRSLYMVVKIF